MLTCAARDEHLGNGKQANVHFKNNINALQHSREFFKNSSIPFWREELGQVRASDAQEVINPSPRPPQAPFTPFITEMMYQNLRRLIDPASVEEKEAGSIHYLMLPQVRCVWVTIGACTVRIV